MGRRRYRQDDCEKEFAQTKIGPTPSHFAKSGFVHRALQSSKIPAFGALPACGNVS